MRSLIKRRPGSPYWYENFTVDGRRFRASLGTDDEEQAETIAAKRRSDALLEKHNIRVPGKPEFTLTEALGRYWLEHGQHVASADDIRRMGLVLQTELGKHDRLTDITLNRLSAFIAKRRAKLSSRSVNAEIEHLRAVMRFAAAHWEAKIPAIKWSELLLHEAGEREHILTAEEERRLLDALRPDYGALVAFAIRTGVRLSNAINLTWRQIDWGNGLIKLKVKSKKPGGDTLYVPMTQGVRAILSAERGRHPDRVFTYVCERNRHEPHRGVMQRKGERYPFTHDGWRKDWKGALAAAGIVDFRFHDLRHTAATRALRAHGNLQVVQKMLGHKDIKTTLRYTKSEVEDVRAAMEAAEADAMQSHRVSQTAKKKR